MSTFVIRSVIEGEEGHAAPAVGALIAAIGSIALGIGAANDTGWLAIVGGIAAGLGLIVAQVMHHRQVDYDMYGRIENLEGKKR